jgi:hypothetical protein
MKTEARRTCPSCGNAFSGAMEFCPVCILRKGLAGGAESGEPSTADTLEPEPVESEQRFDHYELVRGADGKPVELGRGAMGVGHLQGIRCQSPLSGDVESHQRTIPW